MNSFQLALFSLPILLASCEKHESSAAISDEKKASDTHVQRNPYKVDLSESRAYLHGDHISICLVANADNIIQLTVPYPDANTPKTQAPIDKRNTTATLYTGPNVTKFVLPTGPSNPQPQYDQKLYSRHTATKGLITYSSTPNGKLPPECNITISADQIEFTEGIIYSIEEVSLTAYPPPP
jgi:hypothetical protein